MGSNTMISKLMMDLVRDEGLKTRPYHDTVGVLTIGVGRNLEDRGISETEAMYLLQNDIKIFEDELDQNIPWWRELSDNRQRALLNMCFNLGWPRLSQFKNMLAALKAGHYTIAAREALDSKWAKQVGRRANRIAELFHVG